LFDRAFREREIVISQLFPTLQLFIHILHPSLGSIYHFLTHVSFQVHGWPDLSAGWRYQIPLLLDLGFRVVAPDLMGFGETDRPHVPPNPINLYGYKRASDDFALLAKQLGATKLIIGGHDWGGMVVWRMAMVRKVKDTDLDLHSSYMRPLGQSQLEIPSLWRFSWESLRTRREAMSFKIPIPTSLFHPVVDILPYEPRLTSAPPS
jgi:pimeloyl-ACP methyl ester carboxylesterase